MKTYKKYYMDLDGNFSYSRIFDLHFFETGPLFWANKDQKHWAHLEVEEETIGRFQHAERNCKILRLT